MSCLFAEDLRHVLRMPALKATSNGERARLLSTTLATGLSQNAVETEATPSLDADLKLNAAVDLIHVDRHPCSRPEIDLQSFESATKGASVLAWRLAVVEMVPV